MEKITSGCKMKREKYNHIEIEKKWQEHWSKNSLSKVEIDLSKPKYYILDMFPYPSGAGLHVGHVTGYTATDILARYKRQKGFNVLHPMGWDSFGLQAEQYAIRTGTHPKETTQKNIDTYRRQLKSLGFSYDWDREFATSDSKYYKWTQWIFTILYERGLAYEAEVLVNYCPRLGTVLANEEIEDGKSKDGGYPVERRPLRQWILKITDYAERLLADLDLLDWPEYLKALQRHWIGRSEGVQVIFVEKGTGEEIPAFTTRHDTLFAASFLILSPEHPLIPKMTTESQKVAVEAYQKQTAQRSDFEREKLITEKSGVWTGAYAKNPVNGRVIPVWISDYVLMGYGTGAVMGVPGGDERDFEFAIKYDLPVIPPYAPDPEDIQDEELREEILKGKRCWTEGGEVINGVGDGLDISGFNMVQAKEAVADWLEANQLGKRCVTYKLRDWIFSRQRYWGEPFPVLHFADGTKRVLGLDELPLTLPEIHDYSPPGQGRTPLDNVREWVDVRDHKVGKIAMRETNTMPQWAGSCWYYLRFCDPHNDREAWSRKAEQYWMPVDMYVGGVEHAVLHLLYARFWHKVLYDCGYVSTSEPFHTLRNQGIVTAKSYKRATGEYVDPDYIENSGGSYFYEGCELVEMVEKMSKSKLNGIPPDEIITEFGADSLRVYEMFIGPFDKEKFWNSDAIGGCRRFLDRFYGLVISDRVCDDDADEGLRLSHRLADEVEREIDGMFFNRAIAKMMEFVNHFSKLESYSRQALRMATQVLFPFAPHLAEECWEILGADALLSFAPYPQADPRFLSDGDITTYVVQVNGKVRGKWQLPKGQGEQELMKYVRGEEKIAKYLVGEVIKVVYIPDKLLNIVVK